MAQRKYLILYKDGSKRHVDREERDSLLLSRELQQVGHNRYRCTLEAKTLHSFADLAFLKDSLADRNPLRRFLAGIFTVERNGRRWTERLETAEGMAFRLERRGALAGVE